MKKIGYFLLLFFIISITINVKAESVLGFDGSLVSNDNKLWVASGKKLEFKIEGSTSEISWGSGEDAVLMQKQRVKSINVKISTSSNVSCTISNSKSNYYSLSGNVFTLKDDNTSTSNLRGTIGSISCTTPTTNDVINYSKNNYVTITLETTDIDIAPNPATTEKSSETYKFYFGVLSESYVKSLNNSTSITSLNVDGRNSSTKMVDIDKDSVILSLAQNNLANKNKVYLTVDSEKKGEMIKKQEIKAGNKTISLPYGGVIIEVKEITEKKTVLDKLFDDVVSTYGFSSGVFDTNTKEYDFVFNRLDKRSKVNTLKSLMISNVSISFKPELKNYIATVPYKVSSVKINSILTDAKSSYVSGYGNRTVNLKEGSNTVLVKVKAENESVATYTIKITREKNDDSSLKSITVDDKEIKTNDGLFVYSTNVKNEVVKPTIKATANDSKAKVSIEKFNDLVEGENEINITVTASNGMKSIYVLTIVRDTLISTNSKLKNLEVKGYTINFDSLKEEYKVHINYDVDKLDLIIEPEDEKSKYIVSGNKDLENGSVIKVKVTAEDEVTTTSYIINIEKEKKPFNILLVIIPVGLILLGIIIVFVLKKGKKTKTSIPDTNNQESNIVKEEIVNKEENNVSNGTNNIETINENEFGEYTPIRKE